MQKIKCNTKEFKQIKNNLQLYKIFDKKLNLKYLENCLLIDEKTNYNLEVQITSVKEYSNFEDILKTIDFRKFGKYKTKEEFKNFIDKNYSIKDGFLICRIKNLNNKIEIKDKKILDLIKVNTLREEKLGLSGSLVYKVKTSKGEDAILKIQNINGGVALKEEYDCLKYLKDKLNVPNVYYYNSINDKEYLLMEYVLGTPLYKCKHFGFKLGKELKKIHQNYDIKCELNKFSTKNLLFTAIKNIDVIYKNRSNYFKDYTKEELVEFLKINKPLDDALIHGDFSLTNILVNNDKYHYIDLGNASISTKYFDIYVLKKSLHINNLDSEFKDFIKGYDVKDYDEKYLKWMELIELAYD